MKNQTIIIVDGCDRSGKTEISKEISRRLNIPRFKASNEHEAFLGKNSSKNSFIKHLMYADPRVVDLLKQTQQSVVFDRAFPSEFVYSRVLGRKTNKKALRYVDESFASLGTWIVICRRTSYAGINDDIAPDVLNSNTLQRIDQEYKHFLDWTGCKKMVLNVDDEDLDREVDDVMFMMGLGEYRCAK